MWLAIGFGGALGALARWSIGEAFVASLGSAVLGSQGFPWDTLVANVIGCAAIGVLAPLVIRRSAWVAGFAVTGFLGGFTTYSTFSYETVLLLQSGETARAIGYVAGSVILGVVFVMAGLGLGRAFGAS